MRSQCRVQGTPRCISMALHFSEMFGRAFCDPALVVREIGRSPCRRRQWFGARRRASPRGLCWRSFIEHLGLRRMVSLLQAQRFTFRTPTGVLIFRFPVGTDVSVRARHSMSTFVSQTCNGGAFPIRRRPCASALWERSPGVGSTPCAGH